jgi:MOSC domain-containing protein YiiM
VYRRNVLTRGLDLTSLFGPGFVFQGFRFLGPEESRPCDWMNRACCPGARDQLVGNGGLRAQILSDGVLHPGSVHETLRVRAAA